MQPARYICSACSMRKIDLIFLLSCLYLIYKYYYSQQTFEERNPLSRCHVWRIHHCTTSQKDFLRLDEQQQNHFTQLEGSCLHSR